MGQGYHNALNHIQRWTWWIRVAVLQYLEEDVRVMGAFWSKFQSLNSQPGVIHRKTGALLVRVLCFVFVCVWWFGYLDTWAYMLTVADNS
jgi:hypothetical protein